MRETKFRIPGFQALMLPTLGALQDGRDVSVFEVWECIAQLAGLTSEEADSIRSGIGWIEFANQVGLSLTHLRHAGLVKRVRRGVYRLKADGRDLLLGDPVRLSTRLLREHPRYVDWLAKLEADPEDDRLLTSLDRQGTAPVLDDDVADRFGEVVSIGCYDDSILISINYDPEIGMLPAFAAAILECASCRSCGRPPPADFSSCACGKDEPTNAPREMGDRFAYRVDRTTWESTLEPLWTRDYRRQYGRNGAGWRRRSKRIRSSNQPSYTPRDIEVLGDIQHDTGCYYCGTSIREKFHREHLIPLKKGGSNGFDNIVLACPSCNRDKYELTERQYWRRLLKRLSPAEYQRRRDRANEIKREKKRRRLTGRVPEGRFKRKRLIFSR